MPFLVRRQPETLLVQMAPVEGGLLNGAADVMAEVWVGHKFTEGYIGTSDEACRYKGDEGHNILWRLHAFRGLLEQTSSMHI